MASFITRALAPALRASQGAARRGLSTDAHQAHHVETMDRWRKITQLAVPFCGVLAVVVFGVHFSHGHDEHEQVQYSYNKIMKKKYPWSADTCNLFDSACKKKFAAAQQ